MNWILMGLLALVIIWGMWALWSPARRRAPNRLNNQGLPQGYTRDGHRQSDEE